MVPIRSLPFVVAVVWPTFLAGVLLAQSRPAPTSREATATTRPAGNSRPAPTTRPAVTIVRTRRIMKLDETHQVNGAIMPDWIKLSPTGTHLLYVRSEKRTVKVRDNYAGGVREFESLTHQLILRDLATGRETELPGVYGNAVGVINMVMRSRLFSPDGRKVVLTIPDDKSEEVMLLAPYQKVRVVLWNIAKGKTEDLAFAGRIAYGTYASDGKSLLLFRLHEGTESELLIRSVNSPDKGGTKAATGGWILAQADETSLVAITPVIPKRGRWLQVLDLKANKAKDLPNVSAWNAALVYLYPPVLTMKGRYLCLASARSAPGRAYPQHITAFDTRTGRSVHVVRNALLVGPGPATGTVLTVPVNPEMRSTPSPSTHGPISLQDLDTDRSYPVGRKDWKAVSVQRGTLVYSVVDEDGQEYLHAAELRYIRPKTPSATTRPTSRLIRRMPAPSTRSVQGRYPPVPTER